MAFLSGRAKFAKNPIAEVHKEAERLARAGRKVLRLDTGDPAVYFKTPKYIIDAYVEALREGMTNYSRAEGSNELVEAVSRRYARMYGTSFGPDDVIVTAGLSEAFFFLNNALIDRGDSALLLRPYYPPYYVYLKIHYGIELLADYDEERGWDIDIDGIKAALSRNGKKHRVKYMIVTNPNNPTGTVMSRDTLSEIVDIANEHGIFLISDEIYDEMIFGGVKFTSMCNLARGVPHMIWNGASKNFDSTGFRVGFVIVPEQDAVSVQVKDAFANYAVSRLCINTPAQHAVAVAMNRVAEHSRAIGGMVREIEDRVRYAERRLNESQYLSVAKPRGAFYLFPKVDLKATRFKSDNDFVMSLLNDTGVQIRSGTAFGSPGHFRMVSLAPKEILSQAIDKINTFCETKAKR